jgi:hypothetical protein
MEDQVAARTRPVHLWIVGIIAILWNAFGAFDYTMTNLRNQAYLAQFPPEMMTYMDAMPSWLTAFWAFGVWGALAGALLLLMRSRHAVAAFAVSLLGLAVSTGYQQLAMDLPASMETPGMIMVQLIIWAGAIFFLVYAWKMRARGVLR